MKPIIFSTPMVQAILGNTKTQTRRVCRPQPNRHYDGMACVGSDCVGDQCEHCERGVPCPGREHSYWYNMGGNEWACRKCGGEVEPFTGKSRIHAKYEKGDILWVRETWGNHCYENEESNAVYFQYRADYPDGAKGYWYEPEQINWCDFPRWRPSIHMPREAARLFLKVINVRCERLQDISPEDAHDEGIAFRPFNGNFPNYREWLIKDYRELWESINTKRRYDGDYVSKRPGCNWDANPWVWAYTFEQTEVAQ